MSEVSLIDRLALAAADVSLSRREVIKGSLAASAAVPVLPKIVSAQEATPEVPSEERGFGQAFLFVQTFTGGTFTTNTAAGTLVAEGTPEAGAHGAYVLSLGGHPGQTVYFSDRPERIVGDAPTDQFVSGLGFGASNPPNAALVTENEDGQTVVAVVELLNPVVDLDAAIVSYEANLLDNYETGGFGHLLDQQETDEVPAEFGSASLYIDDCPKQSIVCYEKGSTCPGGKVATGNIGQCWNWNSWLCDFCTPCDQWCDDHYGACDGNCDCTTSSNYC